MKNIETVQSDLYSLFNRFMSGELHKLVFQNKLQSICRGDGKKSYWWRFFSNDTLANDYWSVRAMLKTHQNTQYLKECIEIALKEKQLTVYYS